MGRAHQSRCHGKVCFRHARLFRLARWKRDTVEGGIIREKSLSTSETLLKVIPERLCRLQTNDVLGRLADIPSSYTNVTLSGRSDKDQALSYRGGFGGNLERIQWMLPRLSGYYDPKLKQSLGKMMPHKRVDYQCSKNGKSAFHSSSILLQLS